MKYILALALFALNTEAIKLHQKTAEGDDDSDLSVSALAKEQGAELT